jgi:hypothetical protein
VSEKLNILVIHKMRDPLSWRTAIKDLEFMLPTYAPEHNYIIHSADMPIPEFLKEISFHGIILGPTFLCTRYNSKLFNNILRDYDFIRTSNAFKIALPQDDYDCSAILDRWMVNWGVDLLYTVCPKGWDILYPKYSRVGKIKLGYTGYISNDWINSWKTPKSFDLRPIDISYRANKLPPNFGRLGYTKGVIADLFKEKMEGFGFKMDISTDSKDMIPGKRWHEFIENSKFCIVTNSGSSLLDPEGEFRTKVKEYLISHPEAPFEEVEKNCFPGEDGKNIFTAISPRNIEAALAGTVQLATPGEYSGILEEGRDYIRLEADCSNLSEVASLMRDNQKVALIQKYCKDSVLGIKSLRFENHVPTIVQQIQDGVNLKSIRGSSKEIMDKAIRRYRNEILIKEIIFWQKKRFFSKYGALANKFGANRIKNLLKNP